jgi:hypothetical protein
VKAWGFERKLCMRIERRNRDVCAALDIGFAIMKEKANPTRRKPSVVGR